MQEADDACGCLSSCIQERGSNQLLTKIGNRHTLICIFPRILFLSENLLLEQEASIGMIIIQGGASSWGEEAANSL